ncbi:MAG TPA: glycosyltransferase family 39 protein [Nonomuraea sp.]|nr:glycosyltransferase family 39 protein [Nonomuraea sp.]
MGRPSSPPSAVTPAYISGLGLVTLVGAVVRLASLGRQPIGYDEDFTAVVAQQSVGRILDIVSHDSAPPLFYLAEHGVLTLAHRFGFAPAGSDAFPLVLRLVPALAGIVLIPMVAALGRRVGGDSAGLWAAAVVALAPATVLLSGFARMYGPAAALTVAAAVLLWRAVERPAGRRWAAYLAVAVAAVWTSYFSVVALLGVLAAGLWLRPNRRQASVAIGLTALAVATIGPWLLAARAQLEHTGQAFWVQPLSAATLAGTAGQLFAGPGVDGRLPEAPMLTGLQLVAGLAGIACLAALVPAWRCLGAAGRRAAQVCLLASSGVAVLVAVSLVRPLLDARYAGVMWMPLFALAGVGLAALPRRLAVLLVAGLLVPAVALGAVIRNPETSALLPDVQAQAGPNDLVAASWERYLMVLGQASPPIKDRLHVLSEADLPWYVGTAAYPPGAEIHEIPGGVPAAGGLVFWIADPDVEPTSLPSGYSVLRSRCVRLVCLTVFGPVAR